MSKVVFFSIPAYGHTNPTVEVVRSLTRRGHQVRYYSFAPFRERLEAAGAEFRSCDEWLPPAPKDLDRKVGKDFTALMEMVSDTTVRMDEPVCAQLREFAPDVIVADSVCFWGKLFAMKLGIPMVCSTTTFAFNQYSARSIRRGPGELLRTLAGLPRIRRKLVLLREHGYPVKNLLSILQNDNETDTIVYTSRAFQPMAETFSDRYAFVGPTAVPQGREREKTGRPLVYISLGTLMNRQLPFYQACVEAFRDSPLDVELSVGEGIDPDRLGPLPAQIHAAHRVDQMAVLRRADVFVTHCGMNSANEAILCGVPTVLWPQQSEEGAVADRMEKLGVGLRLKSPAPGAIRESVEHVLQTPSFRDNTAALAETFRAAGGAEAAADKIEQVMNR